MFKKRETIIFLIVTIGIILLSILQRNEVDFFYGLVQIVLYFTFACNLIYTLVKLLKDKRQISFFKKVKSLSFGLALIGFFFFLSFLIDTDGGKKKLMVGGSNHDIFFIHFQLFSDNTFKLLNSGPFGGKYFRGTYSLQNDTLILNNDSLKYLYPNLTLALKESPEKEIYFESVDTNKFKDKLFIQTDNRNHK